MSNSNTQVSNTGGQGAMSRQQQQPQRSQRQQEALVPPVDVIEDSTGITLYADVPGLSKDKLEVRVEADTLTLEGEVELSLPEAMEASHAEVNVGRYRRTFTLSKELDTGKVSAELAHGVLTLRIPRAEHAQPRRIEVRTG